MSSRVYPRVGGGNRFEDAGQSVEGGLSPRGRGKLAEPVRGQSACRSIPAWAGETAHGGSTTIVR